MFILAGYLHLVMAVFVLIADMAFFRSYVKTRNLRILKYAVFFIPVFLYTAVWGLAVVFEPTNLVFLARAFVVGSAFVVMILVTGLYAAPFEIHPVLRKMQWPSMTAVGSLGAYFIYLMTQDLRLPIIDPAGFIFWNVTMTAAWGMGILCLISAWTWAYLYYQGTLVADVADVYSRLKVIALGADGVMWGIAGLIYYIPAIPGFGITQLVLAFVLMLVSLAYTAVIYWLPHIRVTQKAL